jgi:BirA family biotin operon repressor/biotin-[acetyl-CoA-carboxylase] ligase
MNDYANLKSKINSPVDCFIFDTITSTNDYLATLKFSKTTQICITQEQTKGRGQYARQWLSQKNSSIILSIRRVFSSNTSLSGLSLVVGLALVDVLQEYGVADLQLKWPNDVYFKDKKLAGILIESALQGDYQAVITGLGLNVDLHTDFNCKTPWIDLKQINSATINKLDLSKNIINKILEYFDIFAIHGFNSFFIKWQKFDYLLGKKVCYEHKLQSFEGVCVGIDYQGALLIKTQNGVKTIYSSEFLNIC